MDYPRAEVAPASVSAPPTRSFSYLCALAADLAINQLLRLVLPLYPVESKMYAGWLAVLATLAIILGALGAREHVKQDRPDRG